MKLYGSQTSPYVRKLRVLVLEKSLPVEFVELPSAADPRVLAHNPLGKVPVLERDDGGALFDSPVIAEYLDALAAPALFPATGEARWQVLRWAALADGILDAGVTRVGESRRPAALQSADAMQHQEGKIQRALDFAARALPAGAYLVGEAFTFADFALAVAIEYTDFRYPHDWRSAHPRLATWHAAIAKRESLARTRPQA